MKKFISLLLSIVMLLSVTAGIDLSAYAETYSGSCGDNIVWSLDSSTGVLTIDGSGEIGFYEYYEPNLESFEEAGNVAPWLYSEGTKYSELIKSVVIEKGITKVGSHAFMNCPNLTEVSLPTGLQSIDSRAFYNTAISEIILPASLTELNSTAFQLSNNLVSITVESGNNSYCSNDGILFNKEMTELIQYPANKSGNSYSVPETVTSIGFAAIQNNCNIQEVILPKNVIEINAMAFQGCESLDNITVLNPKCYISGNDWGTTIEQTAAIQGYDNSTAYDYAQAYGNNFISLGVFECREHNFVDGVCTMCDEKDPEYVGDTSFGYSIIDGGVEINHYDGSAANLVIPSIIDGYPVTSIGDYAFEDCTSLTSVTIPDSVTSIGYGAFSNCTSLTSVTIPDSVTSIGYGAFSNCTSLTSVTIPNNVTSIGDDAFSWCESLTSVTIPDSVTSIGDYAFEDCTSLTSVTIPDSVTSIGYSAFHGCNVNNLIIANGSKTVTKTIVTPFWSTLTRVTIPDSVTSIGDKAFENCTSLTSVTIPDSVTSIGDWAFLGCTSLTSVTIPNSVTSIGERAFSGCTSLTSVTIPDSVTSIVDHAFYNCTSLTSVTIPNSVTSIGWGAFSGCTSLTSVTIPDSVTSYSAFDGCNVKNLMIADGSKSVTETIVSPFRSTLLNVTIPNSVTSIDEKAFNDFTNLTSIVVNENNEIYSSLDGVLFNNDKTLLIQYPIGNENTSYTIPDSVTSIGEYSFDGCDSLTHVTIPDDVTSIGELAFNYCKSLRDVYYSGTIEQWNKISVDFANGSLVNANIHYSSTEDDHKYELTQTVEPTCTEQGYNTYTCGCGCSYIDNYVDATGHSFTNYESDNNATCTKDGTKTAKCDRCDLTDTVVDEGSTHGHDYVSTVTDPTCTEQGYTTYDCSRCSDKYTVDYTSELGHDYKKTVTEPTCTEQGYTTYDCSRCSDKYTVDYTSELGHSFTSYVSDNNANCTKDGTKTAKCDRCDLTDTVVDEDTAFGHDYKTIVKAPTCTEQGHTTYECTRCSDIYIDEYTSPLGHSFTSYVSENNATCTKDGTKTAKCDRCDSIHTVYDEGSALGHDYITVVKVPTCTEKGYTTYTCQNCDYSYQGDYVNALGHSFGNNSANCSVCGIANPNYIVPQPSTATEPTAPTQSTSSAAPVPTVPAQPAVTTPIEQAPRGAKKVNGEWIAKKQKNAKIKKLTKAKKSFKATWKKVSGVKGYQIQYSTSKKFTKKTSKSVTIKKNKTTSKTVKKLKAKKKYYVRIRTYKTVKVNGKSTKVYSSWSKAKTVKTK